MNNLKFVGNQQLLKVCLISDQTEGFEGSNIFWAIRRRQSTCCLPFAARKKAKPDEITVHTLKKNLYSSSVCYVN